MKQFWRNNGLSIGLFTCSPCFLAGRVSRVGSI